MPPSDDAGGVSSEATQALPTVPLPPPDPTGGPAAEPAVAPVSATAALRDQLGDTPGRGAALAADVATTLDAGALPVVLPAAVIAAALRRTDRAERERWLLDQLAFTYPRPPGGWDAGHAATAELIALDDAGRDPLPLGDGGELRVRRIALADGQAASHPQLARPAWALVAGFDLVGLATWLLLWSYEFRPLVCALLSVVLAATLAGVHGFAPVRPARSGVRTWSRARSAAGWGAAATSALSFLVSLLAIDGLSTRDSLLVIAPMVAAGAWIGGGDAVAVAWQQSRRRRVVADLGTTRVFGPDHTAAATTAPGPGYQSPA